LPQDVSLHDPAKAALVLRALLEHYGPADLVRDYAVEPGDFVVVGPTKDSPGHLMIVGGKPNRAWHANPPSVQWTGMSSPVPLVGVYRIENKLTRWHCPY
jgi:hypothetical protein